MANAGNVTVVKIAGNAITVDTNSVEMSDDTDTYDVTCFGAARKNYIAGLGDGMFTLTGVHRQGATGPRKILKGLKAAGTINTFIYQPEGTGSGKAQSSVGVIVKNYTDTSPVAGAYIWKAQLQMSGDLNETDQA